MSAFLFLQRFENGQPVAMPFADVVAILGRQGKTARGRGDLEVTFNVDGIAASCTVVGNPQSGALCIGFERPRFDSNLRRIVLDCMQALQCAAFNDTLDTIYVPMGRAPALPGAWSGSAPGTARQISIAEQLWPDALENPVEPQPVPALRYNNPNPNGPHFQMFDGPETAQGFVIHLGMRPEACNPGTLRILRNLEARVDAAIRTNPEFRPYYRFVHQETSILFLQSPSVIQERMPATIIHSPDAAVKTGFIADRGLFALAGKTAGSCVELARQEYRVVLDGTLESVDALSKLLDAAHEQDRTQRQAKSASADAADKATMRLALLAGAYLGTLIQHHVGGQWGYLTRPGSRRQPAVRMHNGRIRQPHLRALDHIVNGRSDDAAAWLRAVVTTDRSPTPSEEDIAGKIPQFCSILLGTARFHDRRLPFEAQIPRAALNYSVDSLRELDRLLAQAVEQVGTLSPQARYDLALVTGAYLGEVVRTHAADRERWNWVNYDDYTQAHPEFRKQRPRDFGFLAFLDSAHGTTYPIGHVAAALAGEPVPPMHVYATTVIHGAAKSAQPDSSAARAPAQPGSASASTPARSAQASREDVTMKQALANVREALAKWRGLATPTDILAIRAAGPGWVRTHPLNELVAQQALLLQEGEVVWGALLQANNALFKPGPDDHPGAVLFSGDSHFDARPQELRAIARKLFGYKDGEAPEAVRRISEWLANEQEIAVNLPVPPELTAHSAFATSLLFFRKHLPDQVISGTWMPVLRQAQTRAIMVVPRQFWPKELLARWKARALDIP